jgi:hypothetical protein
MEPGRACRGYRTLTEATLPGSNPASFGDYGVAVLPWPQSHQQYAHTRPTINSSLVSGNFRPKSLTFYDSGDVQVSGPITRQGSRWLRWALVTAAGVAIQHRNPFADRYHRLHRKKKPNVAKAALAHLLARCVYGVLKHRCPYRVDRWGRKVGALEQEARGSHRSSQTVP